MDAMAGEATAPVTTYTDLSSVVQRRLKDTEPDTMESVPSVASDGSRDSSRADDNSSGDRPSRPHAAPRPSRPIVATTRVHAGFASGHATPNPLRRRALGGREVGYADARPVLVRLLSSLLATPRTARDTFHTFRKRGYMFKHNASSIIMWDLILSVTAGAPCGAHRLALYGSV